jgi:hypothetical protein|tara:strand:+ start:686 stop:877 length:192 start_codon:yes stop_codon:yes gene_type:complete
MDLVSYLLTKVEKRQTEISETLMSNGVKNMEEYKHYMGQVYALGEMEQILRETRNRLENDDDE